MNPYEPPASDPKLVGERSSRRPFHNKPLAHAVAVIVVGILAFILTPYFLEGRDHDDVLRMSRINSGLFAMLGLAVFAGWLRWALDTFLLSVSLWAFLTLGRLELVLLTSIGAWAVHFVVGLIRNLVIFYFGRDSTEPD